MPWLTEVGQHILSDVERRGGLEGVPVLAGEGVHGSLLEALLALGQSLVPISSFRSATSPHAAEPLAVRPFQNRASFVMSFRGVASIGVAHSRCIYNCVPLVFELENSEAKSSGVVCGTSARGWDEDDEDEQWKERTAKRCFSLLHSSRKHSLSYSHVCEGIVKACLRYCGKRPNVRFTVIRILPGKTPTACEKSGGFFCCSCGGIVCAALSTDHSAKEGEWQVWGHVPHSLFVFAHSWEGTEGSSSDNLEDRKGLPTSNACATSSLRHILEQFLHEA